MERDVCREWENRCVQEQPPACTAACPVHVDVRGMMDAAARQDFAKGTALFVRLIPFPRIISQVCDQPCQQACRRGETGGTLEIRAMEQACVTLAAPTRPKTAVKAGSKPQRAAVVGGGLSGLTVAHDLTNKGYAVTVYEAKTLLGGRVRDYPEQVLPEALIEADFAGLGSCGIAVNCGAAVGAPDQPDLAELERSNDSVYLGGGLAERYDLTVDPATGATQRDKIFAGGGQQPYSVIQAVLQGRIAATSMDRFLQRASLTAGRETAGPFASKLYTNLTGVAERRPVTPAQAGGYTAAEAVVEASRCLQCKCLECVKVCEYLGHFGAYPKRYVREIYNNDSIVMGIRHANKLVNSCADCGLCAEVCPNRLDMGEVCLDARRSLVGKGKMPPSAHDFALRDLAFSNGEEFFLARHEPGRNTSRFLFFPGCQLPASLPDQTEKTYAYLRERLTGGVGLLLGCCGAPAEWAGRQDLFAAALHQLEAAWRRLSEPTLVVACATCKKVLGEQLPKLACKTLWEVLTDIGLPGECVRPEASRLCVHDPCAARHDRATQDQARALLDAMGIAWEEPVLSRELATCCTFGGLMSHANPALARTAVQKRISVSENDFAVYCAMCRDNFVAEGKRSLHLLELIWDGSAATGRTAPDHSQRRENRRRLRQRLLRDVWGESMTEKLEALKLTISPELRKTMQERMILVEDVEQVVRQAEASGQRLLDAAKGHKIAHGRPGCVTYWVEYTEEAGGFCLHNAYSHRMLVVEEAGL